MKHVIVGGSGAVGAVYASALRKGGDQVTLFLREKYVKDFVANGNRLVLHNLNPRFNASIGIRSGLMILTGLLIYMLHLSAPIWVTIVVPILFFIFSWKISLQTILPIARQDVSGGYDVMSDISKMNVVDPNFVWLCVSSDQLRTAFLNELVSALPKHTTLVNMTPFVEDFAYILSVFPHPDRIVQGTIPFISYAPPLPGESFCPVHLLSIGEQHSLCEHAVFFPPFAPVALSGEQSRLSQLVQSLGKGGVRAKAVKENAANSTAFPGAILCAILLALECEEWSFDKLQQRRLVLGCEAAEQAMNVVAERMQIKTPLLVSRCLRPILLLMLNMGPLVTPFDMEKLIAYHFNKVNKQTRLNMSDAVAYGRSHGIRVDAIERLLAELQNGKARRINILDVCETRP